ncbi:hypothetical protein RYJ27_03190 [Microbacterium limosum]|uniref:Uncharacterized protein n=1 Tax=Microbacterium limosum TaxID=3079935 RepID=A0AAU0MJ86_9MICO|nr:hypothetical protein [Microbacterium sp. Y20]WOQ70230.1 hypothetical protein RYJ27_03190 [Microbacterium sp. Y20]
MMVGDLGWNEFNLGILGATAALAGLVIVAASVNIAKIVASRSLTARLGAGIATLVLAITASALAMFPEITLVAYGAAVLASALIAMMFDAHAARAILQNTVPATGSVDPRRRAPG